MAEEKKDQLRESAYDGIQEYDNSLPNWWLGTFFVTVVFGLFYWLHFFVFQTGDNQKERYDKQLAYFNVVYKKDQKKETITDSALRDLTKDVGRVAKGKEVFNAYCVACHGSFGEGTIGPNLTDAYWLHGSDPLNIRTIVVNGVPDKGMTPWKGVLTDRQINDVVAYTLTLEGTNPKNAKSPQGTKKTP